MWRQDISLSRELPETAVRVFCLAEMIDAKYLPQENGEVYPYLVRT